ncbi:uroporphyrinogen-III synthase [Rhodoblastus sphagnicola]|nr:uroporphyrinogen-III synthase [Rhodoblastus sphagnicola]MBB4197061.1 uroporphyrinogen-III synthase [Rhodoblastus sphagnicola]
MRLLVTRPVDEAARTAAKLVSLGHEPVFAPVLEIASTGAAIPGGPFDLVIATSARALHEVEAIAAPLACVGEKTAAAGRKAGYAVTAVAPDAARLVDLLLRDSDAKKVLYLAGRERRADLETSLRAAGWAVEVVEVYAARPVSAWPAGVVAALAEGTIDGALHYSPRSAELALNLIGEARARLAHYCLSPAVAAVCARHAGTQKVFTASQPTEDYLMTLIGEQSASLGVKTI